MPKEKLIICYYAKGEKCEPKIFIPEKLTFRHKIHRQAVINMDECREYCFHELFLRDLPDNELQTTHRTRCKN